MTVIPPRHHYLHQTRDDSHHMGAPTRTGFTRSYPLLGAMFLDRPRWRGVYTKPLALPRSSSGSSPLARGLRPLPPARRLQPGIIPAPAGFTPQPSHPWSSAPDHPRTRGVYARASCATSPFSGSSPLARGLRDGVVGIVLSIGIIPARAGFTIVGQVWQPRAADHPRSRGVYAPGTRNAPAAGGSSPLARGLRQPGDETQPEEGIIPARAGFTCWCCSRCRGCRDHPRSRGVYIIASRWRPLMSGSSPLARGLHGRSRREGGLDRIIPARAGFTLAAWGTGRGVRDHPRSRGVYSLTPRPASAQPGSSPLARGLLLVGLTAPC